MNQRTHGIRAIGLASTLAVIFAAFSTTARAEETAIRSVFLYMVDVNNTMVGCPKCYAGKRTDDVIPAVIDRIVGEVRLAEKPLDVYVVPFARSIIDFDSEGPFDPWRKFAVANDADVDDLAEYLDPVRYGRGAEGQAPSSVVLPTYGSAREGTRPWPGFHDATAERDLFTPALYDSVVEGLNFLRNLPPRRPDDRAVYARTHRHKLVVFSDGRNAVKSASYPHIVQATELHREEMDGRFWLTRIYMEGQLPDETVDEELFEERRIAESAVGVYRLKDKVLPAPAEMLRVSPSLIRYEDGLRDPSRYPDGELDFEAKLTIEGAAPPLAVELAPSRLNPWPEGASLNPTTSLVGADGKLSFRLSGTTALLRSGMPAIRAKVRLSTPVARSSEKAVLFLESGAPEIFRFVEANLSPPTGHVRVSVVPPGGAASESGDRIWNLGELSRRGLDPANLSRGRVTFGVDEFVPSGPLFSLDFDETLMEVWSEGRPMGSGQTTDLSPMEVVLKDSVSPGEKTAILGLKSIKTHVVFGEDATDWKATFQYKVNSDLPLYAAAAAVALAAIGVGFAILRKTVLKPALISELGGVLTMSLSPEADMTGERDLAQVTKSSFTVGGNPGCDWVLKGDLVPDVAFEIRRLRGEGRLRVRKQDPEIENVRLNDSEMVENFLKDGDVIRLQEHVFVFRRAK